ncbi:MAG: DNA-3-methyladenine glycosylase I [Candidatus Nucleicultricaceae bacterium]
MKTRCGWCEKDQLYRDYHDQEWGVPVHDDQKMFEFLILEGMQAGLSWYTILKKRDHFRDAFDHFDPLKIAHYGPEKVAALLENPGIIRNQAKIKAVIKNAQAFLSIQEEYGNFNDYIWQFTGGKTIHAARRHLHDIPSNTPHSDAMSKDLKQRGFNFVGTTICYAHMQATGMVNDHLIDCFRYAELTA